MTAAPGWYPDPSHRHELRYWNGTLWTEHVATAEAAHFDPIAANPTGPGTRRVGWAGLVLMVLAVLAVAGPAVEFIRADDGVVLDGSSQKLSLPPGKTYGIYVADANNSGYSQRCSIKDEERRRSIPLSNPPGHITGSDTETLDWVFNTGSGDVTIRCSVPGEQVSTREFVSPKPMIFGLLVAGIAGTLGLSLLIVWLIRRTQRPRPVG